MFDLYLSWIAEFLGIQTTNSQFVEEFDDSLGIVIEASTTIPFILTVKESPGEERKMEPTFDVSKSLPCILYDIL